MYPYLRNGAAVCCLFTVSTLAHTALAQTPAGEFSDFVMDVKTMSDANELIRRKPLVPRIIPRDIDISERIRMLERPKIERVGKDPIALPLNLQFKVSKDRSTVLQYGDALLRMHPARTDIFWISDKGEVQNEVRNTFDGEAILDMAQDGFAAVAGAAFLSEVTAGLPKPKRVVLFDPNGKAVSETKLDASFSVQNIVALSQGKGVVYVFAPTDAPLEKQELALLRNNDAKTIPTDKFGIIQKISAVAEGEFIFVQGSEGFGLISVESGEPLWITPESIRLVGANAVAVDDKTSQILLMTGVRVSDDALYAWTLTALDLNSGKPLAQTRIDGQFPGTNDIVFQEIKDGIVTIQPGDKQLMVTIRQR